MVIKRIRVMLEAINKGDKNSKLYKLLIDRKISNDVTNKLPYIVSAFFVHVNDDGSLPTPGKIISTWRVTFKGCMRFSNGNTILLSYVVWQPLSVFYQ